jgi:hypothetical protein
MFRPCRCVVDMQDSARLSRKHTVAQWAALTGLVTGCVVVVRDLITEAAAYAVVHSELATVGLIYRCDPVIVIQQDLGFRECFQ